MTAVAHQISGSRQNDRRESVRVRRKISVQYKAGLRISGQRWTNTFLADISETGICIRTDSRFKPHSYIRMRLRIPTEKSWLMLTGRAVRSDEQENDYATHVRFTKLDKREKQQIRTYIAWVLVKEGGS
jgi:c-di-GMP-binding flagellar brake protein YcgR